MSLTMRLFVGILAFALTGYVSAWLAVFGRRV